MREQRDFEPQELLADAAAGDGQARARLLHSYRGRLRRMIETRFNPRLVSRADPSDIVQEAMKDAYHRLPEYFADPQISFYPWLRRIAVDRLADAYRVHVAAERRSVLREHRWVLDLNDESAAGLAQGIAANGHSPGRRASQLEMQQRALAALQELKPFDREILALRYLEQLTVKEIAEVLQISETSVTSRHLRALQRLRRLMNVRTAE